MTATAAPGVHRARRVADVGPDWIVPTWSAPANVRAFVTTRNATIRGDARTTEFDVGGPPHDERRDAATRAAVAEHRRLLRTVLPSAPVWLDQVHGTDVVDVAHADDRWPRADAAVTRAVDVVLAIRVADCLPVLFAATDGSVIGAAHAGWRGLAAGVLENTLAAMRRAADGVVAWIGPCIGARAYEVGADVRDAFVDADADASRAFERAGAGKWLADLETLARQRLARAHVAAVTSAGLCTATAPQRFFSYRRDASIGRMAAFVWRTR